MEKLSGRKRASSQSMIIDGPSKRTKLTIAKPYAPRKNSKYAPKVTSFKQVSYLGTVVSTATGDSLSTVQFTLGDIPGAAQLANVFDEYKIDKVDLTFVPDANSNNTISGNKPMERSILYTAFDPNDSSAASTLNELIQYQNCSQTPYLEKYRRTVYPHMAVNSADEEGTVTISSIGGNWARTSDTSVLWYGLKIGASANGNAADTEQTWKIHAKFYLSFKNIK